MSSRPSRRRSREEAFTTPAADRNPRRRRVVVRERLPSGKLLFLLFDPASTSDAEQVQAMFEQSISDLFEPGMHEWRQVTIPTDESHHDQYLLAAASLTMWLTVWQQNNTVFRDNSVELKFVPNASSTSLVLGNIYYHEFYQEQESLP
jgi:hypothetical protein